MKHEWKLGWKEHRGYFIDRCLKCGALRLQGYYTLYVRPDEAEKYLTTINPRVEFVDYFPCKN